MSMDVSALKGIGPKKAARLEKMHISTVEDLLYLFPRDYQDRRSTTAVADLHVAAAAMIHVVIRRVDRPFSYRRGKKNILRLRVEDASGSLEIIYFNAAYLGIDKALDTALHAPMIRRRILTGDIDPGQMLAWDDLVSQMAALFEEIMEQNQ